MKVGYVNIKNTKLCFWGVVYVNSVLTLYKSEQETLNRH